MRKKSREITIKAEDSNECLIERTENASGRFSLIDDMRIERGSIDDWKALHALHYKAESLPAGPRYWRVVLGDDYLVGIVVTCSVSLLLAPRHDMFPKLKPGKDTKFTNVRRGKWLNANFRRSARIVTDTMFRGVGVSYRMVNLAMRMEGYRFMEIQSSMSKFNPFDIKAGFKHANLKHAAAYERGLKFFAKNFRAHPADHEAVMEEFRSFPPTVRDSVEEAMKMFYYRNSAKEKTGMNLNGGSDRVMEMDFSWVLKELQQLVFASPVYGVWENPDLGRDLPESLPLSAFDLQKPNEPLRLDLL